MESWMLPRISEYWDVRANAIFQLAQRLEAVDRNDRGVVASEISRSVENHLDVLAPGQLESAAVIMVDDLYRSACNLSYWNESIPDYLKAKCASAPWPAYSHGLFPSLFCR